LLIAIVALLFRRLQQHLTRHQLRLRRALRALQGRLVADFRLADFRLAGFRPCLVSLLVVKRAVPACRVRPAQAVFIVRGVVLLPPALVCLDSRVRRVSKQCRMLRCVRGTPPPRSPRTRAMRPMFPMFPAAREITPVTSRSPMAARTQTRMECQSRAHERRRSSSSNIRLPRPRCSPAPRSRRARIRRASPIRRHHERSHRSPFRL